MVFLLSKWSRDKTVKEENLKETFHCRVNIIIGGEIEKHGKNLEEFVKKRNLALNDSKTIKKK